MVVHEFGHLIAAKIFNVYCHEFSIGMGPKLFSKKFKETTYSIRAIPVGGFVAMAGDTDNALETSVDVEVPKERTLIGIAQWKKIIIMLAGIIMNLVLAIIVIAMILLSNGTYAVSPDTTIGRVLPDSAAELAGLQSGDFVREVSFDNGISSKPSSFNDLVSFLYSYDGNGEITFSVIRDGQSMDIAIKPTYDATSGSYVVGINSSDFKFVDINILNCWYYAFDYSIYIMRTIFMSLSQLIRGFGLQNLSGPLGIYQATEEAVSLGFQSYFMMFAVISLNVGIFNALPIPIMDGGRVLITIIEMIIKRPISEKMQNSLMTASLLLLLALLAFATFQDIVKLF